MEKTTSTEELENVEKKTDKDINELHHKLIT